VNRNLRFSIVTPSFNQADFIGDALASVQQQNWPSVEHLVMDGSSTDETVGILERYSSLPDWGHLQWKSERDQGQSHALNKGFAAATGDVIGWLNSDDRYRPHCFEQVAHAFAEHPDADIIYGDYCCVDETGRPLCIRREIEFSSFVLLYHRVLYIPTTTTFFRRRIFDEGNLLDEQLHYALDAEFFIRLANRRYRFRHLSAVLADFRFHPDSKTCSSPLKQLAEKRRIMEDYSPVLRALPWPLLRRGIGSVLRSSAAGRRYSEKLLRGYYHVQSRRISPVS
jgi:glycosyltransferase involved in cell wall biosynthesis